MRTALPAGLVVVLAIVLQAPSPAAATQDAFQDTGFYFMTGDSHRPYDVLQMVWATAPFQRLPSGESTILEAIRTATVQLERVARQLFRQGS